MRLPTAFLPRSATRLFATPDRGNVGRIAGPKVSADRTTAWAAFALLGCATLLSSCGRQATASEPAVPAPRIDGDEIRFAAAAPQLAYLTVEPAAERPAAATALTGRLAWDDDITARIFAPVSGRLVAIVAQPGQRVATGDTLAKIRSPDFGQAQADACKALADATLAERALSRARDLLAHRAAAQKDVESAEADYARALSEKERALATLSLYGGDAADNRVTGLFLLRTPVDGVVVDRSVSPGQEVRADQLGDKPLFVVSDPSRLWLFLDVTETDAAALKPNQQVAIHTRTLPGRTFHGRVQIIGEGLDPATRTIKVRCLVDNADRALRAEMYVNADLAAGSTGGVEVPTTAIFTRHARHYAFVETAPAVFARQPVEVGPESNGRSVVQQGLPAGARVVTDGCLLLEAMLDGGNP